MERFLLVLLAGSIIVLLADISYSVAVLLTRPPMENSLLVELIHELKLLTYAECPLSRRC